MIQKEISNAQSGNEGHFLSNVEADKDAENDFSIMTSNRGGRKARRTIVKLRRRQVSRGSACVHCVRSKSACDSNRPCSQCLRRGAFSLLLP
jgi:hypothetical protein